jgi:hypothetical protein
VRAQEDLVAPRPSSRTSHHLLEAVHHMPKPRHRLPPRGGCISRAVPLRSAPQAQRGNPGQVALQPAPLPPQELCLQHHHGGA